MPHELDRVELLEPVAGWPAGTAGTVVDVPAAGWVTLEVIVDDDVSLLDALVDAPTTAVRVTERMPHYA
jgi:hypothetical protein